MTPMKMRHPDAELRLPDGTQLTLFRNVKVTGRDEGEIIGDWMVALEPRKPRAVVYFYQRGKQQVVEMIYDKHMQEHGEHSAVPPPETLGYVFCNFDDKAEEAKYLTMYRVFPQP